MSLRIAIPEPTSLDVSYNSGALPQYIAALQAAGAVPVLVALQETPARVARLLATVHGVLLPGSKFDIDPQVYGEVRTPACHESDPARTAADELLLQDAFNLRKPLLGICGGMQALNVWRNGSLVQDLPTAGRRAINHAAGREVEHAHEIRIEHSSRLAEVAPPTSAPVHVNSSHHQAIKVPGDNLRICATCPDDGVIEAIELRSQDQFVLGVQWHPERTYGSSALSRAIFAALVHEAQSWATCRADATVPA
ncbi:MAG TPA: gamma-glutamyl-gamma-aminobutyrate hydrolase family protein [Terracidiphilus sp.]|jgi:putative glutamine amidotransferase